MYNNVKQVPLIAISLESDSLIFLPYNLHPIKSKECVVLYCYCMKNSQEFKFRTCSKCLITQYCSTECQRKDWKEHKKSCNLWSLKK